MGVGKEDGERRWHIFKILSKVGFRVIKIQAIILLVSVSKHINEATKHVTGTGTEAPKETSLMCVFLNQTAHD